MVNLDHNATTPLDPEVFEAMLPWLRDGHGNPSSIHSGGRRARAAIDTAREGLADLLGVKPQEIIFTPGGTESCNLGVMGLARAHAPLGRRLTTAPTEHHAVLHACEHLAHHEGFELALAHVDAGGLIHPGDFEECLLPGTTVASIMHANNETGVIQPIRELALLARAAGVFFHTDAIQSFGKLPVRPNDLCVDALSITAHKFGGPVGAGALFLRSGIALSRTLHGGSHEGSRRPGTENVAGIVGLARAAELAIARLDHAAALSVRRDRLWAGIRTVAPQAIRNGNPAHCLANTLSVSFPGADGEALLIGLDLEGICASSGSACMAGSVQTSHVLPAMGIPRTTAAATVRFSLGHSTSDNDISDCLQALERVLERQAHPLAA